MSPPYHWSIPDLGYRQQLEGDDMHGEVMITEAVQLAGSPMLRPAVIAKLSDVATGALAHRSSAPRIALTVDLAAQVLTVPEGDRLVMLARLLKAGRTTIIGEARFTEPGSERLVAIAHATFTPSPRPEDVRTETGGPRPAAERPLTGPYGDQIGVRVVSPGVAEVDHRPAVVQASGTIQGGVIALLGELAAESVEQRAVVGLEVRYLSTVRVGPARASAVAIGPSVIRVEVRDVGAGDRLAALIMARTCG